MITRNLALAATVPDGERSSYVRVTAGAHPVSDEMRRLALLVRQYAHDVLDGEAPALTMAGSLTMLSARLNVLAASAEAVEECAALAMERTR